jgi:hypothetical protein
MQKFGKKRDNSYQFVEIKRYLAVAERRSRLPDDRTGRIAEWSDAEMKAIRSRE